ncbi:MAG: succinylglutamate desuccinylase/aspartoacylase family protein [Dyadobacter sp.]|uniref:succinylglutamate desuccinylase/aspartoacylase family protein n=1 Tax=Dyadobacter sp. TaxID=1914288 RepID=UPI001B09F383|nr:M14 family metallopeptidase [Dyadobacter sp.]MBO9611342.1 succinylglutamate desuccinylase/aspartoacylase family protein [Dyadobacter sp.]
MKESTENVLTTVIAAKQQGPAVLISAGVHGDEYEPMAAAARLAAILPTMLMRGQVTVVTVVNPDAYTNGTRQGSDGLDLARVCPGSRNGSVSEAYAARISTMIEQADYYVDMHTGGLTYEIHPLAGYMLHPDEHVLDVQRQMARCFDMLLIWGTDYRPQGRTLSVARDANVPAIYLEFGGGTGFRQQVVDTYVAGMINLLRFLGMVDGEVSRFSEPYWLEDHRADSGYLQGKMPSPAGGILMSEVALGEMVSTGQCFGHIFDPMSGASHPVYADVGGVVFLKRAIVKVASGDALGGILPITQRRKHTIYE